MLRLTARERPAFLLLLLLGLAAPAAAGPHRPFVELAVGEYRPELERADFDGLAWGLRGGFAVSDRLGLRFGLSFREDSQSVSRMERPAPLSRRYLLFDAELDASWTFGPHRLVLGGGPGLRRTVGTDAEEFESTEDTRTELALGLRISGQLMLSDNAYLRPELGLRWYGDESDEEGSLAFGWRF